MCTLLVSALLYLLVALYVEQIRPGEYGVPQPWNFPFTRTFWLGTKSHAAPQPSDTTATDDPTNFEHDPAATHPQPSSPSSAAAHRTAGIQIRQLRKTFGRSTSARPATVAVHGLTLDMYENDITVLLGHNGAGKTTTMSMLTGMLTPTAGTALVNGYDIRHDIRSVRGSVGLCPQHNILFDDLTVAEHIEFYARLKGVPAGKALAAEVDHYLRLIELLPKRAVRVEALSGGMKRKLSVCVAFCGGSRVVFCDEPTAGMDPAARRALWEVFGREKRGRTVLLSTHFMDEADVLGDRIAIMNAGRLVCAGSSYFLKKRFGAGYHLVCVKAAEGGVGTAEKVMQVLQRYDAEVRLNVDGRTEVSFVLAEASAEVFEVMFGELERRGEELGVRSFGVSLTTLEEVFLKVGADGGGANGCDAGRTDGGNAAAAKMDGTFGDEMQATWRKVSFESLETVGTSTTTETSGSEISCKRPYSFFPETTGFFLE